MNAGELKTRIRIQRQIKSGNGSFAESKWVDIGDECVADTPKYIFAKWINVHGSEAWIAESVQAQRAATITLRYRDDIDETCRVLYGGTVYQIVSLNSIREAGQWLEIKVKAAVNG